MTLLHYALCIPNPSGFVSFHFLRCLARRKLLRNARRATTRTTTTTDQKRELRAPRTHSTQPGVVAAGAGGVEGLSKGAAEKYLAAR